MSYSSSLSPLGTFKKLPPEIRLNIWLFLMPPSVSPPRRQSGSGEVDRSDIYERPKSRLSILCASRELYEEVSNELYSRELCFYIRVGYPGFIIKHDHSPMSYYQWTPLHRFRNVAIELEAPADSIGPGLLLRGMESVMSVAEFMIFRNWICRVLLHQIDIRFVNGAGTTWTRPGGWNESIPESLIIDSDYFLGPFRLLNCLGNLKIHAPEGFEDYGLVSHCIRFVTTSIWSSRYGLSTYRYRRLQTEYYRLQEKFLQIPDVMWRVIRR